MKDDGDGFMRGFEAGVNSVLNDLYNAIAELEDSRSDTGYGRSQKYILRQLIEKMDMKGWNP